MEMSKETQQALMQMQMYQQQLEQISMQKQTFTLQRAEIEKASEELKASKDEEVFKNLGPVMIKTTKDAMVKDLEERMAQIDDFITKVGETEKQIHEGAERVQKKLEEIMKEEEKK